MVWNDQRWYGIYWTYNSLFGMFGGQLEVILYWMLGIGWTEMLDMVLVLSYPGGSVQLGTIWVSWKVGIK